jgi:hypothetical protein
MELFGEHSRLGADFLANMRRLPDGAERRDINIVVGAIILDGPEASRNSLQLLPNY